MKTNMHSRAQTIAVAVKTIRLMDRFGSREPTATQIQEFLEVSKPTAYRYLNSIRDARGTYTGPYQRADRGEQLAQVRNMRREGLKWDYIAAVLGVHVSTAKRMEARIA